MLYMSFAPSVSDFLFSIVCGAMLGALWDCFRIIRKNIGDIKFLIFILDVTYFILLTVFTICYFFFFTSGGFRVFVLLGEFLGFTLYYCSIERPIFFLLNLTLSNIFKIFYNIYKFIKKCFLKLTNFSEKGAIVISKKILSTSPPAVPKKPKFKIKLKGLFKLKK